jgi:hypothetical protein
MSQTAESPAREQIMIKRRRSRLRLSRHSRILKALAAIRAAEDLLLISRLLAIVDRSGRSV